MTITIQTKYAILINLTIKLSIMVFIFIRKSRIEEIHINYYIKHSETNYHNLI